MKAAKMVSLLTLMMVVALPVRAGGYEGSMRAPESGSAGPLGMSIGLGSLTVGVVSAGLAKGTLETGMALTGDPKGRLSPDKKAPLPLSDRGITAGPAPETALQSVRGEAAR